MALVAPGLRYGVDGNGAPFYSFHCPGCNGAHVIPVGEGAGPRWGFDGNEAAPTFAPSLLISRGHYVPGFPHGAEPNCACNYAERFPDKEPWPWPCCLCHSFVVAGVIQFLDDCTHALAGQHVPIPAWPAD